MKAIHPAFHSLIPILVMASPIHAIEAPEDDAPPPAEALGQPPAPPDLQQPNNHAFLGIVTEAIPEVLREHLGLKARNGIMIRSVFPDSPASKAGLAPHDVITSIGDKEITTPEQLTDTIRSSKPGDTIKASLVHQGDSRQVEIILGERPAHIPMAAGPANDGAPGGLILPDAFADRIRQMLENNQGGIEFPFMNGLNALPDPEINDAMRELQERLKDGEQGLGKLRLGDGGGNFQFNQATTFRMMDEQGSVEVKSANGSKEVTVRDKENNMTWNGPWDTEQDKAAAPEEVRRRIERLNIQEGGAGLRLQIGPDGNR